MSEHKIKTEFSDSGADLSARPVWISKTLYELIRKMRKENGGNTSSVVEELIQRGIRCRNIHKSYDMHCRLCDLANQNEITEGDCL